MTGVGVESLLVGIICGARVLGMFAILPLGWDLISLAQRLTLTLAVTVYLMPWTSSVPTFWGGMLLTEFFIGIVIGLPAAILVEGASYVGELFDSLRGETIATAYEPLQREVLPISGTLAKFAVWALLLSSGAAIDLIEGLAQSLTVLPLGVLESGSLQPVAQRILIIIPQLVGAAFAACVPFAVICLMIEVVLAFISKQMPQLSLVTEGIFLKLMASVLLASLALNFEFVSGLVASARPMLRLLTPGV